MSFIIQSRTFILLLNLLLIIISFGYGLPTASISRLRESLILVSVPVQNRIVEERELTSSVLSVTADEQKLPIWGELEDDAPWPNVNAINITGPIVVRRGPILILGPPEPLMLERVAAPRGISPCSCEDGQCGCCTGNLLGQFGINLRQKACMNLTYIAEDFEINLKMYINNRVLYSNVYSGKNPKPVCVPFPRIPNVKFCVRFTNVYFIGRNFHACLALEGRWQNELVFSREYDCIRMGSEGVAIVKPEEGGGIPTGGSNSEETDEEDEEDYDDIVFSEEEDTDEEENDNNEQNENQTKRKNHLHINNNNNKTREKNKKIKIK